MQGILSVNSTYTPFVAPIKTVENIQPKQNDSFEKASGAFSSDEKYFFPDGISSMIINQGNIDNCQSLAAIDALSRNPEGAKILNGMLKRNSDGKSIDVFFACMNNKPINVTLDEIEANIKDENKLLRTIFNILLANPVDFLATGVSHLSSERPLGVRAIEAAYAKYMKMTEPDNFKDDKVKSVYNDKKYHSSASRFMKDITGLNVETIISYDYSRKDEKHHPALNMMPEEKRNEVLNVLNEASKNPDKYILTACSTDDAKEKICWWHDYSIRKVDMENNTLTIVNPWNTSKNRDISIDAFMKNFESLSYIKLN